MTADHATVGAPLASADVEEGISMGTAERIDAGEETRRIAQHESGHVAGFWALGSRVPPFDYVSVAGADHGSHVVKPRGWAAELTRSMLIGVCGMIADYQRRGLAIDDRNILRLLLGDDDCTFELIDVATGEVAERVSRPSVAAGHDLELIAEQAAAMAGGILAAFGGDREPAAVIIGMWRQAEQFVAECRPAIDALAAQLLERGSLTYLEACSIADAAMAGLPKPAVPGEQ